MPAPSFPDCHSFVVRFEIRTSEFSSFALFQGCFCNSVCLEFLRVLRSCQFLQRKGFRRNFNRDCAESVNHSEENCYLKNIKSFVPLIRDIFPCIQIFNFFQQWFVV